MSAVAPAPAGPGLGRKVKKITEIKTETPELLAALATLSTFYEQEEQSGTVGGTVGAPPPLPPPSTTAANPPLPLSPAAVSSSFASSDPAAARTGLRGAIERRGLASAREFLRAADRVGAALDAVDGQLAALGGACAAMQGSLQRAQRAAAPLLAEVNAAQREAAQVEARRALVGRFLADYQLGAEEAAALRSGEVGPAFFAALERAGQVRERCAALLKGGSGLGGGAGAGAGAGAGPGNFAGGLESAAAAQRAGLELMDQMGAHQDAAYETLCRWVQSACRALAGGGADGGGGGGGGGGGAAAAAAAGAGCGIDLEDADPRLAAAIAALARRPVLYRFVADEVVAARHSAVFQRLIVALTRGDGGGSAGALGGSGGRSGGGGGGGGGGSGGGARPIELHAHDPRRYVADMLAWAHQALASERELVYALFGGGGGGREGGGGSAATATPTPTPPISADDPTPPPPPVEPADLLDRIFESVCRPLKARIEQVLLMSPPPLTALQIQQLLSFYQGLVAHVLGPKAALSTTLASLKGAARRAFLSALKNQGDRLLRAPPTPAADLAPPLAAPEALALLRELAAAHASSLAGGGGGSGGRTRRGDNDKDGGKDKDDDHDDDEDDDGAPLARALIDAVVDPLLEACRRGGEVLSPHSAARLGGAAALDPAAHPTYLANCYEAVRAALQAMAVGGGGAGGGGGGVGGGGDGAWSAAGAGASSTNAPPPPPAVAAAAEAKAAAVAALLAEQVDALVAREAGRLLKGGGGAGRGGEALGLGEVAARLRQAQASDGDPRAAISADPALAPERVAGALNALFATLASAPDALPEFPLLQAPRLRADAARRVAGALADAYTLAYEAAGGRAGGGSVRHTPQDLRTVLGL